MQSLVLCILLLVYSVAPEHVRDLEVSEGTPVGTRIGYIGDGTSADSGPPYLIVPVGNAVDSDLNIDQNTGEIRTKVALDRETRSTYSLVAIPMSGENVRVMVRVLDENDNAPTFPADVMSIEFPENTPRDVKRTLHPARDLDLDVFNTQRYNIIAGNLNNAFRLSSHRERDGVLYLDLQINGFLDRETTSAYSLVIEALDGGSPPLRGEMTVNITIQDVNDNQPIFNQSRYFAIVPENATVSTTVLQVFATDSDASENGQVEYSINRRQSDRDNMFRIDASSGLIAVNKPLDFETKELHELVIVARDHGLQPLETTAFVSIKVTDVNDNQPIINVIFLSDDATPKISESAQPGEFVARISVNDPDLKTEYSNINVTLSGGDGHFGLTTRDNIIYLVIVSLPLDREAQPNYTLQVVATDTGTPPLHASRTISLMVTDINDNAPEFTRMVYETNVMEVSDPGTSVIQVQAHDKDEGNNSFITYSLSLTPRTHSTWFTIDPRSGLITTRAHVDCETDPVPELTVIATDNGFPPLSSTATVLVTIHDVNDNEPIFDQSFYNVTVAENEGIGRCILKVAATDPDCGVNAVVNYTLGEGFNNLKEFEVRSATGEICITAALDYETRRIFEFPVIATDRGGLSTNAMLTILLTDVNDNSPTFYPLTYNVSLREGHSASPTTPILAIAATDPDSGRYGSISYRIVSGNEAGLFRIDRSTGELFVSRPSLLSSRSQAYHRLNVSAVDGGGLKAAQEAEVYISVIDASQRPPMFERARYTFAQKENVRRDTVVGTVRAMVGDINGNSGYHQQYIRYSIYSGDPDGLFVIDPVTGALRTAQSLDHESRSSVLLNVQATNGDPPIYGHTQVAIDIEDVNDNPPEFESATVRISVPENAEVGAALYAANARDRDSGRNGIVRYKLSGAAKPNTDPSLTPSTLFDVDAITGHLTLNRPLDYESQQRHTLMITATDSGSPALSANLTVLLEVQDVNDNAPVFEQSEYEVRVIETSPVNSQILQVTALDLDTGNNARITYRISSDSPEVFGIFPNSGWLYLRSALDREQLDSYDLTITATDNGTPTSSAACHVHIHVQDANDNDPVFARDSYEFAVEENLRRGSFVGTVSAADADVGVNADLRYYLIPGNGSFHVDAATGELVTREPLDREQKETYDIVAEARDQGVPARTTRIPLRITVLDVNDNAPEMIDPKEDVISVREEQPPGIEVVKVKAVDVDKGENASVVYSILKGRDSDGFNVFTIDPQTGVIRTRVSLDHAERTIYRLSVAASDDGRPSKQTVRALRIEILDLNDNRPTFTSSSLVFRVREDVKIGHVVGSVATAEPSDRENLIPDSSSNQVTYTLTSLKNDVIPSAFEIDRSTGSLVVSRQLDRELQHEYRLEVRALDTSAVNNPQSSAVTVRVDIADANDNAPRWTDDLIVVNVAEDSPVGSTLHNFTASDLDANTNGELRYALLMQFPGNRSVFSVDSLTGALILLSSLDYEVIQEYVLVISATDQPLNASEHLSSSITARILITDANDNAPAFIMPSATQSPIYFNSATSIGMPVAHIIAIDRDSGDNGRVTYVISGGNTANMFVLGYDTGVLTLAKPATSLADPRQVLSLNITASDHGAPIKQTLMNVKLAMQNSVDHSPSFINSVYYASVAEDAAVGAFVIKVLAKTNAEDTDMSLHFEIPSDVTENTFTIDKHSGTIRTTRSLDREKTDKYIIPIYVTNSARNQFDVSSVHVTITDVNDNAPKFKHGSCYSLSIPENSDTSVIHTVVAYDEDINNNKLISYTLSSGNHGSKFSIDSATGELTAKSLDREQHERYYLVITAHDHGSPATLQSTCNVTVFVEDQNDNDPRFESSEYIAMIPENAVLDTSVLKVMAKDADVGVNGRLIYTLTNETQSLFRIDNKTGVITTAGLFDREVKSQYEFMVIATDSGKYTTRSQKVPVTITIEDVNDNKPIFAKYPFREKVTAYIQPGQTILTVIARDADEGTNSEIVYSLQQDYGKFRINPNSGILTASQSLASDNGKILYLNVVATDKGNPLQSTVGLVEVTVGDLSATTPNLRFQNATYRMKLEENTAPYKDLLQVSAIRTDGRRQNIFYSFGMGNENNVFVINADSGVIQVKNPKFLDYEAQHEMKLVVEGRTDGNPSLHGYCEVIFDLLDQNDNAPKFTQQQYVASIREGENKGAFVLRAVAFDLDQGQNSRVLYHIVDGNHDNAFKIEPAFSGVLKTNIVLDREIRDAYRLTVIATDEGVPQMTGTARIRINVIDINDNQPTFPPHKIITVKEDTEVGTVLTAVTANDVDSSPALTYAFAQETDKEVRNHFAIDRFSGKVVLKDNLDFEARKEFALKIIASDMEHTARTLLTIKVLDVNDNAPEFSQSSYQAAVPEGRSANLIEILNINATDKDTADNAMIKYSIPTSVNGFTIGLYDGILFLNQSNVSSTTSLDNVLLTVKAEDSGNPPLHSLVSVRVQHNRNLLFGANSFENKREYRLQVSESTPKGSTILHLSSPSSKLDATSYYQIIEGNQEGYFEISNQLGQLMVINKLDREHKDAHVLKIATGKQAFLYVYISVEDSNDNAPIFTETSYEFTVSEGVSIGHVIAKLDAIDNDLPDSPNTEISYDITSGNDEGIVEIDQQSGELKVSKHLDYDSGNIEYNFVVRACDKGEDLPLCTLCSVSLGLEDVNDNEPRFPVTEYFEFVGENEPTGSAVFTVHATDLDRGVFGKVNYSMASLSVRNYNSDDSTKLFSVDSATGLVSTNVVFDYEQRNRYLFMLRATDIGGKSSTVKVRVEIESKDEFHPQFTERTYKFVLATPPSGSLPVGYVIGHVTATDRDKGPDGRIAYQLTTQHQYFKMNRTSGAVILKRKIENSELLNAGRDISLVVTASSGKQGSLTNMTVVEIVLDPLGDPGTNLAINRENNATIAAADSGIADWALGLLIALLLILLTFGVVFVFLHMKNKKSKKVNKPNLNSVDSAVVPTSNNYVDPSAFDTIPIRNANVSAPAGQFAPPKYDEIPPYGAAAHPASSNNSGAATTSELSGSEQSGSSGRGSAEDGDDGEDEEIRMINEGPLQQRDSGIHRQNDDDDDDNLSDVSVRNTQEYLARLGIVNNSSSGSTRKAGRREDPLDSLNMFNEEETHGGHAGENDITNFYAKLNDVTSERVGTGAGETEGAAVMAMTTGGYGIHHGGGGEVPPPAVVVTHQPSMNGSLSSIVHSEEELAGSYNWDYLLDWGPQYQPLAHVFSEIARLKDDTLSVHSGASASNSSVKSKNSAATSKTLPPPLITAVAPRAIPFINSARGPRSPINHDANGPGAMSPSFSPSLSPLANKSPSISPLVTPGLSVSGQVRSGQRQQQVGRTKSVVDTELRI